MLLQILRYIDKGDVITMEISAVTTSPGPSVLGAPDNPVPVNNGRILSPAAQAVGLVRNGYFEHFGIDLPKGMIIRKSPDEGAVSEGIGFAGLILAGDNSSKSQEQFWKLFSARDNYFLKDSGVMAWKIDLKGNKTGTDSASDGDQDCIASMITVYNKLKNNEWALLKGMDMGKLRNRIIKDLSAFWSNHVKNVGGRLVFLSTDGKWAKRGDGKEIYYPSYPDPHFLRLFAEFDKGHTWGKLCDDVQDLNRLVLEQHRDLGSVGLNPMPAKVFVSVREGAFVVENYYKISRAEGASAEALIDNEMDSIRFLLRQSRAVILDRDPKAMAILNKLLEDAQISTPDSARILAGQGDSKWGYNNTLARACYGIAVFAAKGDISFVNTVIRDFRGDYFGTCDNEKNYYYDQSLILQAMDLAK